MSTDLIVYFNITSVDYYSDCSGHYYSGPMQGELKFNDVVSLFKFFCKTTGDFTTDEINTYVPHYIVKILNDDLGVMNEDDNTFVGFLESTILPAPGEKFWSLNGQELDLYELIKTMNKSKL